MNAECNERGGGGAMTTMMMIPFETHLPCYTCTPLLSPSDLRAAIVELAETAFAVYYISRSARRQSLSLSLYLILDNHLPAVAPID